MLLFSISVFNHSVLNTAPIEPTFAAGALVLFHRPWISKGETFWPPSFALHVLQRNWCLSLFL